jgi:transcriptional regulator with XRE-family HTH domain
LPDQATTRKRFDSDAFYAALDASRQSQKLTWKKVAEQAGVSASTLTRMAQGKRPDVDSLAALCMWGGLDAAAYMRTDMSSRAEPDHLAMVSTYLRSDPNLRPEAAEMLDSLIKTTYESLRKD